VTYYDHPAKEAPHDPGDGNRRECFRCGVAVTGFGDTLTHFDEHIRTIAVPREYLPAVRQATEAIEMALSQVTNRATDAEFARAAAVAIFSAGLLRVKPVKPTVKARS
jgi:hypothetical protein